MEYEYIKSLTLKVYADCKIYSFPINCFDILEHYGVETHAYSQLSEELRNYCKNYSDDALNYKNKVCYNDAMPVGRIRFSLMHELGHKLLGHTDICNDDNEKEANCFASNFLAPRMAIHYSMCMNLTHVSKLFNITNEAAQYALDDYRRWHRWTISHGMNELDKSIYKHFYNPTADKFVYSIKRCAYCDDLIYNSSNVVCDKCADPMIHDNEIMVNDNSVHFQRYTDTDDYLLARNQWLYGGL